VIKASVENLPLAPEQYDLIYMDAPYNKGLSEAALQKLSQKKWLQENALCMVEVEKTEQIAIPSCYQIKNERIYGLAKIIFLRYKPIQ